MKRLGQLENDGVIELAVCALVLEQEGVLERPTVVVAEPRLPRREDRGVGHLGRLQGPPREGWGVHAAEHGSREDVRLRLGEVVSRLSHEPLRAARRCREGPEGGRRPCAVCTSSLRRAPGVTLTPSPAAATAAVATTHAFGRSLPFIGTVPPTSRARHCQTPPLPSPASRTSYGEPSLSSFPR